MAILAFYQSMIESKYGTLRSYFHYFWRWSHSFHFEQDDMNRNHAQTNYM